MVFWRRRRRLRGRLPGGTARPVAEDGAIARTSAIPESARRRSRQNAGNISRARQSRELRVGPAAGQAPATRNTGCSSATCSRSTGSRCAIAISGSTSCSSRRRPTRRAGGDASSRKARATTSARMRTINIPILALLFFERRTQPRLKFEQGKAGNVSRFEPLAEPADSLADRLHGDRHGDAGQGRQQARTSRRMATHLDRQHQRPRPAQTELISEDDRSSRRHRRHLPARAGPRRAGARPRCARSTGCAANESRIDGRATYSKFRQFTVTTTESQSQ